jgi:hypothetical protein
VIERQQNKIGSCMKLPVISTLSSVSLFAEQAQDGFLFDHECAQGCGISVSFGERVDFGSIQVAEDTGAIIRLYQIGTLDGLPCRVYFSQGTGMTRRVHTNQQADDQGTL